MACDTCMGFSKHRCHFNVEIYSLVTSYLSGTVTFVLPPRQLAFNIVNCCFFFVDDYLRSQIDEGIKEYHKYTCLRFVKRTNEKDYIRIMKPASG